MVNAQARREQSEILESLEGSQRQLAQAMEQLRSAQAELGNAEDRLLSQVVYYYNYYNSYDNSCYNRAAVGAGRARERRGQAAQPGRLLL